MFVLNSHQNSCIVIQYRQTFYSFFMVRTPHSGLKSNMNLSNGIAKYSFYKHKEILYDARWTLVCGEAICFSSLVLGTKSFISPMETIWQQRQRPPNKGEVLWTLLLTVGNLAVNLETQRTLCYPIHEKMSSVQPAQRKYRFGQSQ